MPRSRSVRSGDREKPQQPLPVWSVDPMMLAELVAEVGTPGFHIRPPRSYKLTQRSGPQGAKVFVWRGAARSDGTAPYLMVVITTHPPGGQPLPAVETALDRVLGDARWRWEEWQRTSSEVGQVNGLRFGRVRWSGIEPNAGVKTHGFLYVAIEGRTIIQLSSQDVEPHHDTALKVAETSILTFRSAAPA